MYKWGFFILLAVNTVLLGKQVFFESEAEASYSEKPKVHTLIAKSSDRTPPIYKNKTKLIKTKKVFFSESLSLEDKVKNSILERYKEEVQQYYDYLFKYHQLDFEKIEKVELILADFESEKYDCHGFLLFKERLVKRLNLAGLDEGESEHVFDLINKQSSYNFILSLGVDISKLNKDLTLLVKDVEEYSLNVVDSSLTEAGLEEDPFADADPFDESYEPEVVEETVLSELESEVLRREEILAMIEMLNKAGLDAYYKQLEIYEQYFTIDDEINLRILSSILN